MTLVRLQRAGGDGNVIGGESGTGGIPESGQGMGWERGRRLRGTAQVLFR